jgi:hypothetical protein
MNYVKWSSIALLIFAIAGPAQAWGTYCKFRADRAAGIDAAGVEKVIMRIGAGDLKVIGKSNAVRIEARGVACSPKQELLDAAQISVRREGNVVIVETALPQYDKSRDSWGDNEYATIDIGIALPDNIPVEAIDSSGDAEFQDLLALDLRDSSGDLRVSRITGLARVHDSSGDIEIADVGSAQVEDSSGDIDIRNSKGTVDLPNDSSGDIEIRGVRGNVIVRNDSSGGIRIEDVDGSVEVKSDSSGDIRAERISGDFTVGYDSSGSISHQSVKGKISLPSGKD